MMLVQPIFVAWDWLTSDDQAAPVA